MNIQIGDVGHIIQLSIAPVFLLAGVGTTLMVLINRLARIIDRSRVLEDRLDIGYSDAYLNELDTLYRRAHLIDVSITLATSCALLICLVIAMLFLGDVTNLPLDKYIAGMFVVAMACLIGSFVSFLREIFIASAAMRSHRHVRQPVK